jgi:hypothetical protein
MDNNKNDAKKKNNYEPIEIDLSAPNKAGSDAFGSNKEYDVMWKLSQVMKEQVQNKMQE